jgi:hypothetical protein
MLAAALFGSVVLAETPVSDPVKTVDPVKTAESGKGPQPVEKDSSKPAAPPPKSLYTRMGGANKIAIFADDLVESLYKDAALGSNIQIRQGLAEIPKSALRYHVTTLLCQLFRGPEVYSGQAVHEIYLALKLTEGDWKALETDLEGALDRAKFGEDEKKEAVAAFVDLKKQLADVVTRIFNEKGVFAVMPLGWERQKATEPGVLIAVIGPMPEKGTRRPAVQILMEEFKPGLEMTAKEFLKASQYQMSKAEPTMKDIKTQSMQLNGEPIEALACTVTNDKQEISMELFYFVKNKRGYTFQFIGPKDTFEANKTAFGDVLRSLKIE